MTSLIDPSSLQFEASGSAAPCRQRVYSESPSLFLSAERRRHWTLFGTSRSPLVRFEVILSEKMGLLAKDIPFHSNIPRPVDTTVAVVYSIFGVCSLFGNSTLLYVSYKKKHLLKPAEYFIINLAVSDLGLTLSLYPLAITSSFYHRY
ncbi:opsin-5-like [Austrofundulus limnaeus]|uniref:Opsin-5-like n=1 Tax=Austrofundulus limnaeus TaxID=52670 RepID=A0A2I4CW40_AUSLI|nr:PREDICTED: opsin-5-like [Austrofundulus limnaeus]